MRYTTKSLLGLLFLLTVICGPVHAQTELLTKAAGLIPQSGQGDEIRSAFNANVDRVRLMVLLSPT